MTMNIEPFDATLGARITGVKLDDIDTAAWELIYKAFLERALLIFPQQHLSEAAQERFAERFGSIEILVENMKSIPLCNKLANGRLMNEKHAKMKLFKGNEGWHTDSSYMPLSAKASVLSAHVLPTSGAATQWADARAGYDALDESTKIRIADLNAHHSYFYSQAKIGHKAAVGDGYGFFEGEPPLHPLVKVHPETGRPSLYIGRHAGRIPGMEDAEAEHLIESLVEHTCQPPRVHSHRWVPGDLAVWDNRCLLHRAMPFDIKQERLMLHTRISGDAVFDRALNA